jgi:dihydroxy-acid dehydratase
MTERRIIPIQPQAGDADGQRDVTDLSDGVIKGRLRTLGLTRDDIARPIIAIANTYNEIALPHRGLRELAAHVKLGIAQAGGVGLEFNTIAMCDGIAQGLRGMKYVLPSRELIADSIEAMVAGHPVFSGMVCLGACDKTIPAMLMAAARLDIPTVILGAGPVQPLFRRGVLDEDLVRRPVEGHEFPDPAFKEQGFDRGRIHEEDFIKQSFLKGLITKDQLVEYYADAISTAGTCTSMATANSMGILAEALGMSLPGSFLTPLNLNQKLVAAKEVGGAVVNAVRAGLTPRRIMTRQALENAVAVDMAIGGSMNTVLHLLAVASELGIPLSYDDFERIGSRVPFIVDIKPNGRYNLVELYQSGGTQAVMHEIQRHLHLDCLTVAGATIGDGLRDHAPLDRKIIFPVDAPLRPSGSLVVLRGNIATEGAIAKPITMGSVEEFVGPAVVFESENDFFCAAKEGLIRDKSVIVVRNEGPKGGPGMSEGHRISEAIRSIDERDIALITDSRFSGATIGVVVGYVSPEAAAGGNIALIENGDTIRISIRDRALDVLVEPAVLQARRERLPAPANGPALGGYLQKYQQSVSGAACGAVTK